MLLSNKRKNGIHATLGNKKGPSDTLGTKKMLNKIKDRRNDNKEREPKSPLERS